MRLQWQIEPHVWIPGRRIRPVPSPENDVGLIPSGSPEGD